jgi:hypothetical protein
MCVQRDPRWTRQNKERKKGDHQQSRAATHHTHTTSPFVDARQRRRIERESTDETVKTANKQASQEKKKRKGGVGNTNRI